MNPMTSLSALSANMGAFGIIATILAIIATVAAFILVVPESKRLLRRPASAPAAALIWMRMATAPTAIRSKLLLESSL